MTLIVPTVGLNKFLELGLTDILSGDLMLKLYSNNIIPSESDTAATYTVVSGGGYANITLDDGDWTTLDGVSTQPQVQFNFTGATDAPTTIYGYYVVNADNVLMWAERFSESVVPFVPTNGSSIKITPRFEAAS